MRQTSLMMLASSMNFSRQCANAAATVHREYGFRGFWRGSLPRMFISMSSTGVLWLFYKSCKYLIGNTRPHDEEAATND